MGGLQGGFTCLGMGERDFREEGQASGQGHQGIIRDVCQLLSKIATAESDLQGGGGRGGFKECVQGVCSRVCTRGCV